MKSIEKKPLMRSVWATSTFSTWEISDALTQLCVSHSILIKRMEPVRVVNLGKPQPKWVHVSSSVRDLRKGSVNFITASYAELSLTNYPRFPQGELLEQMKVMLLSSVPSEIKRKEMRAMDYVNEISKPSLLNKIQTQVYKIQPYSLRKETQAMILAFFTSRISKREIIHSLQRSFKTEGLIPLIQAGGAMREAVARLKNETVEAVALDTDLPTFELLYLSKARKPK